MQKFALASLVQNLCTRSIYSRIALSHLICQTYHIKHPFIHKKIFGRLSDIFHQEAFNTISNSNSKLRTYALLKKQPGIEKYLLEIDNPQTRQACTKLRLSNHTLNIETGRHKNIPKDSRFCHFCPTSIESEIHFILDCRAFKTHRKEMLQQIMKLQPSFTHYTQTEKFQCILSEENIQFTSKFVHDWFEIRKFLLAHPKRLT